jgi:hypothetical protein
LSKRASHCTSRWPVANPTAAAASAAGVTSCARVKLTYIMMWCIKH